MSEPRLIARLLGTFAILALLMSTLGVCQLPYGATDEEVALRRALGADGSAVMRLLGMPTIAWTLAGLAAGIAAAVAAASLLRSVVLGATRLEVSTVAVTAALYLIVVSIAVAVPAARALRIQPASVLRAE